MFQKTYSVTDYKGIYKVTAEIKKDIANAKKAVLFVFDENFYEIQLKEMLDTIKNELPNIEIVGSSSHNTDYNHVKQDNIDTILSLICFEESSFEVVIENLDAKSKQSAVIHTRDVLNDTENAKGIFMLSSAKGIDISKYMGKIIENNTDIPIFGVSAAFKMISDQNSRSFVIYGNELFENAVISVIFHGKDLYIESNEEFGWTPIGKKMTVTKVSENNVVQEIDGKPAVNIYSKYLGLSAEQIMVENVCEFPLFKRSGEHLVARISTGAVGENGGVQFGAPFYSGDEIRFSYGNPDDIFSRTKKNADKLIPFEPQALFLVVCMNRIIFLGKDQEKEIDDFKSIQDQLVVIRGNSELFRDNKGGGELNSAFVYAAMREGKTSHNLQKEEHKTAENTDTEQITNIPFAKRLLTFLDVTTKELEELRQNLAAEVEKKTEEILLQQKKLYEINHRIIVTLSNAIDAKDKYTNGHSIRVAQYSKEIAKRYGYDERKQNEVYMIGLLHDVGKIGVPDTIINKPGRLTDDEFAVIKTHPSMGADILSGFSDFPEIAYGAHWHHERYDGKGYPDGLKGDNIPEIAQIISVADAYDAMTSNRSYRAVMPQERVRSEIEKGRGTQFSPKFADIMLEMIDDDIDYKMKGDTK